MARRPFFGLALVLLVGGAVKALCPGFVAAPNRVVPSTPRDVVIRAQELEPKVDVMSRKGLDVKPAVEKAMLSAAFALMAEPAWASEPGSYDIREEQAKNFIIIFSAGSFLLAAGIVFVISKANE